MSPSRSPQHVLEDRSRVAFALALPSIWVVRDVSKDYGIDTEVEIFDAAGSPTGATFKVQLKSTSSRGANGISQKVKLDHLRYWNSLDVPVLVALWIADEGAFYVKWAVSHDPGITKATAQWTTIKFAEEDRLVQRIADLEPDVAMLRQIYARHMPQPAPLRLHTALGPVAHYQMLKALRTTVADHALQDLLHIVTDQQQPALEVRVSERRVTVAMPLNAGSISFHSAPGEKLELPQDALEVATITAILFGVLLTRYRDIEAALQIAAAFPSSPAFGSQEVAVSYAEALLQSPTGPDLATKIGRHIVSYGSHEMDMAIQYLLSAGVIHAERLSDPEQLLDVFATLAARAEARGEKADTGAMVFNGANILRKTGRFSEAVGTFRVAKGLKTAYATSPEFHVLVGGAAFKAGLFRDAADAYRAAADLGDVSAKNQMHLADALLWTGEYEAALQVIDGEYGARLSDRLSIVNRHSIHEIVAMTGLNRQDRRIPNEAEADEAELSSLAAQRLLTVADALQPRLWINSNSDTSSWTLGRAVLLSRLTLESGALWALSTVKSFESDEFKSELYPAVVDMAIADAADNYLDALADLLSEQATETTRNSIMEYAYSVAAKVDDPAERIYFFGEDGRPMTDVP